LQRNKSFEIQSYYGKVDYLDSLIFSIDLGVKQLKLRDLKIVNSRIDNTKSKIKEK